MMSQEWKIRLTDNVVCETTYREVSQSFGRNVKVEFSKEILNNIYDIKYSVLGEEYLYLLLEISERNIHHTIEVGDILEFRHFRRGLYEQI